MEGVLAMRDPEWHPACIRARDEERRRAAADLEEALQCLARGKAEVEDWMSRADEDEALA